MKVKGYIVEGENDFDHNHKRCIRFCTPTLLGIRAELYYGCSGHYVTVTRTLDREGVLRRQVTLLTFRLPYRR